MDGAKEISDLQEVDLKLDDLARSLSDVRARLADDTALTSARVKVERLEAQLEDLSARRRAMDRAIVDLEEKLKAIESRLYSGTVTSQRGVSAAEEEREFASRQHRREEDRLLELMVEAEDLQVALAQARATLGRLETDRPAEVADLRKTEKRLEEDLARQKQKRAQLADLASSGMLSVYESLRESKKGVAVARVDHGICLGCRLALTTMELQRARSSLGITQCSSCQRILYVV